MIKAIFSILTACAMVFAGEIPSGIQASKEPVSGWQVCWITFDRELFSGGWHKESGFATTAEKTEQFYTPDSKSCEALADRLQQSRPSQYEKPLTSNQGGAIPRKAYAKTFTTWQFNDSVINDSNGTAFSRALSKAERREIASDAKRRPKAPNALVSSSSH